MTEGRGICCAIPFTLYREEVSSDGSSPCINAYIQSSVPSCGATSYVFGILRVRDDHLKQLYTMRRFVSCLNFKYMEAGGTRREY